MAEVSMTTMAEALKIFYLPAIVNQINYESNAFFSEIEKNSEEVVGLKIVMAMRYGRQGGVGNRDEYGDTPMPGARKIKQVEYNTKNIMASILITDKMMKVGKEGKGSFANVLQSLLQDSVDDAKDQFGRQLYGDGVGKLATCTAQTATTLTLTAIDTEHTPCQFLSEGLFIDIVDTDGVVKVEGREILMVDDDNDQITISGTAVTTVATDTITINGNLNMELTGLASIFQTTGSIYGVDRDAHKWIIPNITPVNDEIDEIKIQKGIDKANKKGGGRTNFLLCSDGVKRAYQDYQTLMKRNTDVMTLKGGYNVLSYNGMPFVDDKYCPLKTLFGLIKEDFKLHQIGEWDWMDADGKILSRKSGKAAYEATLIKYADLGCKKPAAQFKLTGITEA